MKKQNLFAALLLTVIAFFIAGFACDDDDPVGPEAAEPNPMLYRESWIASSKPVMLGESNLRGWLNWYNPYDRVATTQIWTDSSEAAGDGLSHVLHLYFEPETIDPRWGEVDYPPQEIEPTTAWSGIMYGIPYYESNFANAFGAIVRLKGSLGILHIDLGEISEDINGDGLCANEDAIIGLENNVLDDGEDLGLDLLPDMDEPGYDLVNNPDPHQDNWIYYSNDPYNYRYLNGTEGNKYDPGSLGSPDREDCNRDNVTTLNNNYFSFTIDLSIIGNPFYVTGTYNEYGWRTFRLPFRDTTYIETYGTPNWSNISVIRLWVESPTGDTVDIEIAQVDILKPE